MLYDLSSSYVEGRCCPLASLRLLARRQARASAQVNYGLTCSPEGRPVAIGVHDGNTQDQQTLPGAVAAVRERFGIADVVVVGDRGMLTRRTPQALTAAGVDFVSALKSAQIRALVDAGDLQLSLFDETNLAEISSDAVPRRAARRLPQPRRRRRTRAQARRAAAPRPRPSSRRSRAMVDGPRGRLRSADAGKIGERVGKVVNQYKVAKHFELEIADGAFAYQPQERPDRRRGRARRPLRDPHHLPHRHSSPARPRSFAPTSSSRSPSARSGR